MKAALHEFITFLLASVRAACLLFALRFTEAHYCAVSRCHVPPARRVAPLFRNISRGIFTATPSTTGSILRSPLRRRRPRHRPPIARTICGSSLVKCAIHGRDPNWGRIVAASGRAGVPFDPEAVALWIGEHQLMAAGQPLPFDRPAASSYMAERAAGAYLNDDTVRIRLWLGDGPGEGRAWGCDLSDQYVRINADYTT
jgi:hypothetical protein